MQIRIARGMSRNQLAKKAGMGTRQILRLETEHPDVAFSTVVKLARALDCSTDWLGGLSEDTEGRITESDLPPGLQRLLKAYRSAKSGPDKLADMLAALANDKTFRGEK